MFIPYVRGPNWCRYKRLFHLQWLGSLLPRSIGWWVHFVEVRIVGEKDKLIDFGVFVVKTLEFTIIYLFYCKM